MGTHPSIPEYHLTRMDIFIVSAAILYLAGRKKERSGDETAFFFSFSFFFEENFRLRARRRIFSIAYATLRHAEHKSTALPPRRHYLFSLLCSLLCGREKRAGFAGKLDLSFLELEESITNRPRIFALYIIYSWKISALRAMRRVILVINLLKLDLFPMLLRVHMYLF